LVVLVLLPYLNQDQGDAPELADRRFARVLLCTVSVLLPVVVYPIPGTQVAVGSLGLLLAVLIVVADCLRWDYVLGQQLVGFRRGVLVALLALCLLSVVCRDVWFFHQRRGMTALELAGSQRLRLPASRVERQRWTVAQLRQHADAFVCYPHGRNSLHLWSHIDPPTGWNTTLWPYLLSDRQQEEVIEALARSDRACAVVDRADLAPVRRNAPLARFIQQQFEPVLKNGSVEIWMPRRRGSG
jgi:hypothetical protein